MAKTEIGHRQAKVLFLYAAKDFEKLKNMNSLRNVDINRVVEAEIPMPPRIRCGYFLFVSGKCPSARVAS
jgi:hypothetical protein